MNELVEAIIKVSPHVWVKMYPPNALGGWGCWHIIQEQKWQRETVEDDILEVKKLAHTISYSSQGPQIELFQPHLDRIVLQGIEVEGMKQKFAEVKPEQVAQEHQKKSSCTIPRELNVFRG